MKRRRGIRVPFPRVRVSFDVGGYDPKTRLYAVTCPIPACGLRSEHDITGGRWPTRCPLCRGFWAWEGVTVLAAYGNTNASRRGEPDFGFLKPRRVPAG